MADEPTAPTPEEVAAARAVLAQDAAAKAAQRSAAQNAITALAVSPEWLALKTQLLDAAALFPADGKDADLEYAIMCMGRIEKRYVG